MRTPSKLSVYTTTNGTQITVRSALEARWAIFFSELHLEWAYEPGTLGYYNPDFCIKGLGFIEIKPTLELLISETASKIERTTKAFSFPGEKIWAFIGNKVSFDLVALWTRDGILSVSYRGIIQAIHEIICDDGKQPFQCCAGFDDHVKSAMRRANTAKLDHFVSVGKVIDLNRIAHEETARFKEQFK